MPALRLLASCTLDDTQAMYVLYRQWVVPKRYLCYQGRGTAVCGLFKAGKTGSAISLQMSAREWVAFDEEGPMKSGKSKLSAVRHLMVSIAHAVMADLNKGKDLHRG